MVRCRASSSIQPSIRTSLVSYCCTTAATRPAPSCLSAAATSWGSGLAGGAAGTDSTDDGADSTYADAADPAAGTGVGCSDIGSSLVPSRACTPVVNNGTPPAAAVLPNSAPLVLVFQVMHFVEPSREVLAETLLAAGPDAP